MRKLTQREKILVYIAAVLLLLTGGYYLVEQPAEMRRVRTETELKILQLQERESEDSLTGKSTLEEEIGRTWLVKIRRTICHTARIPC